MIKYYGLLYIDDSGIQPEVTINTKTHSFEDKISIYAFNAVNFAVSLKPYKIPFCLLTNNAAAFLRCSRSIETSQVLEVTELKDWSSIPKDISFYSAHHKIDAFRYFSSLQGGYHCLVDLDVECVGPQSRSFLRLVQRGVPTVYDISHQVIQAYGEDRIIADLDFLTQRENSIRWLGGEFIGGTPLFFENLWFKVNSILPRYTDAADRLHHHGDEMLVTAAIAAEHDTRFIPVDIGTLGVIHRHWRTEPKHAQLSLSRYLEHLHLVHLPQDKRFLAKRGATAVRRDPPGGFLKAYRNAFPFAGLRNLIKRGINGIRVFDGHK